MAPSTAASHGHMLQRYRGGDECAVGSGTKRSTEVHLRCTRGARLTLESITEPHTCHYLFRVSVPKQHCKVEDAEYVVADDDSATAAVVLAAAITRASASACGAAAGEQGISASSSPARLRQPPGALAAKPLGPAMRVEELEALAPAGDVSIGRSATRLCTRSSTRGRGTRPGVRRRRGAPHLGLQERLDRPRPHDPRLAGRPLDGGAA